MKEKNFKLLLKNMVCPRCISSVENILKELKMPFKNVGLGEVTLTSPLSSKQQTELNQQLKKVGFEIIESRLSSIIEKIKLRINEYLDVNADKRKKLSSFIVESIPYDYGYLSDLFSSVEGITIEHYFINRRIEKVKEFLVYDQLSLSEIAYQTGYSSSQHLSLQFKQVTGLTPSHFKMIRNGKS